MTSLKQEKKKAIIQEFCILKPLLEEKKNTISCGFTVGPFKNKTFAKSITQFLCENLIFSFKGISLARLMWSPSVESCFNPISMTKD